MAATDRRDPWRRSDTFDCCCRRRSSPCLVMINDRRSCAAARMEGLKMDAGGEQRQQQQQLRRLLSMYVRRNEEGEEGRQLLHSAVSCSPLGTRTFGRILGAAAECRLTAASHAPSTPCCPFLPCPAGLGRLSRLRLAQLKEKRGGTRRNACATCNAMAKRISRTRPRRGKRGTNFPLLSLALMRDKCKSW